MRKARARGLSILEEFMSTRIGLLADDNDDETQLIEVKS